MAIDLVQPPTAQAPTSKQALDINKSLNAAVQRSSTSTSHALIGGNLTGNSRGAYSIDIQTYRTFPSQVSSGSSSLAIGNRNRSSGSPSTTIGNGNSASGDYSSSFGVYNVIIGHKSLSIGGENTVTNTTSGYYGTSYGCIAVGQRNDCAGEAENGGAASAVGVLNTVLGKGASAFGYLNYALDDHAVAVGAINSANGQQSVTVGFSNSTVASSYRSIAFGCANSSNASSSVAVGDSNIVIGWRGAAFGYQNNTYGENSLALGFRNLAGENQTFAIGHYVTNLTANNLELGYWSDEETRNSAVRVHGTGYVVISALKGDTAYTAGGTAFGTEQDGQIFRNGLAFRVNSAENQLIISWCSPSGTIKNATLSLT